MYVKLVNSYNTVLLKWLCTSPSVLIGGKGNMRMNIIYKLNRNVIKGWPNGHFEGYSIVETQNCHITNTAGGLGHAQSSDHSATLLQK